MIKSEVYSYPSDPSTALLAKHDLPGGLQRLKELVWLEKGPDTQRIQNPKRDQKEENITGVAFLDVTADTTSSAAQRFDGRGGGVAVGIVPSTRCPCRRIREV